MQVAHMLQKSESFVACVLAYFSFSTVLAARLLRSCAVGVNFGGGADLGTIS
jgi:hypothetical protein